MRFGTRVKVGTSAFCCSVDGPRSSTARTAERFRSAGFGVLQDEHLSMAQDCSVMFVMDTDDPTEIQALADSMRAVKQWTTEDGWTVTSVATRGTFVPVWSVFPRLAPLGMSLLLDDEDASFPALDALHSAGARRGRFTELERHHMTIRPP